MSSEALEAHCIHAIGGGWGQETQDDKHTERVAVIRGTDIPRATFGDISGIPLRWETPSKVKSRLLQAGDIVIEVSGGSAASGQHTGRALVVSSDLLDRLGGRVIPASFCRLLRLDSTKVDPKFICYQIAGMHLTGEISEFENQSTGIANFQFTRFISDISPALDELGDQREVAAILSALDDRITLLRETNTTLEAIAQALFKSWFVDFDPVHAKLQGRTPEGMDDATAALFPDSFEESELGAVPKGWQPARLDSFIELAYGKALKSDSRRSGSVPVYGSGGITGWHDTALVNEASVVIGRKGTVGSIYWESRPFFPIDTVFYVKASKPLTYCHQLLMTLGLNDMNTDAAVPGLNRENVYRLQVPDVPSNVTMVFDEIVSALRQSIDRNNDQVHCLSDLRDTLLPRLISGQLRVNEALEAIQ